MVYKQEDLAIKTNNNFSIGIDLEEVDNLTKAVDFGENIFYIQNLSQKGISYCPDPLQSFAGKFAVKEAIVKADNSYLGVPFSQIEIDTDSNGNLYFMNFKISISHTDKFAIAVAITMQ